MPPPKSPISKTRLSGINVFLLLLGFRICNALLIRTFFQPDEYFQSLEPAWDIAFGGTSGAWITWEWRERLRSSLHPFLFAAVYRIVASISSTLEVPIPLQSELLIAAPKLVQATFAATTDFFVWSLAEKAYGKGSGAADAALFLTITSPWQWFCSTRTLSNCLETAFTAGALWVWPFEASSKSAEDVSSKDSGSMRAALALAALATVLRPTNAIIWIVVALYTAVSRSKYEIGRTIKVLLMECREAITSGLAIISLSLLSDRLYYTQWTFPPFRFIHFNVVQSLAVFYGKNRPDYYLTEGLPLLLTTLLPFTLLGLFPTFFSSKKKQPEYGNGGAVRTALAISVLVFIGTMSLISHKEVRFIYPLLPALIVISAPSFARFFSPLPVPSSFGKKCLLVGVMGVNVVLAFYITQVHQRGVVDVTHYLRREYETRYLLGNGAGAGIETGIGREGEGGEEKSMTVLFLMPCHSTPWRSHLIHTGIRARALTCEPPLHVPLDQRSTYLDEADQFYENPERWLEQNMEDISEIGKPGKMGKIDDVRGEKAQWPEYLVFFEQLEEVMEKVVRKGQGEGGYREFWRGFNTHWHDDWRRQGDVVVWCRRDTEVTLF